MTDQVSVLRLVTERLDAVGIAYMLTGSIAAGYYAQPRMTRDIDLVVELKPDDAERIAGAFTPEFNCDVEVIPGAIARQSLFNLIHVEAVAKVDFVVRKDIPYRREEFRRRRHVEIGGHPLWIVSPEDLILSKLAWAKTSRSEMQLRDVSQLLTSVPTLEQTYLDRWAANLTVTDLLREVRARAEAIRLQREPFEARGERVEAFAPGTRFPKERLWHVEITFNMPIAGPLVIGDGRFLGLGLMAPVQQHRGVQAFVIEDGVAATAQPTDIARALRRAVMARVQEALGARATLPTFFSGHEPNGSPVQTESRPHLTFLFDPGSGRLLIVAPHVVDRRDPTREERTHLETLDTAMTDFRELRAGSAGRLMVRASAIDPDADPLFAPSRVWESVTPYQVTRHTKHVGAAEALSADVRAECRRRSLPEPRVTPIEPRGVPGVGLVGGARLTFEVAVKGPVILGRSRHLGGGLFAG